MRALVVDDDATVRSSMIRLLRRDFPGLDVLGAESADQAIALLEESACIGPAFDFVVCDYNLLGARTGGDVLDWIQTHLSYLERRFVFLSSDEAIRQRGVPFFEKPCDISALRATLNSLVANH